MHAQWILVAYAIAMLLLCSPHQVCSNWSEDQFSMFLRYFTDIGIKSINVYSCSIEEAQKLARFTAAHSTIIMSLHDLNGGKDLVANSAHYIQGVIIDFNCLEIPENWMNLMLNASYSWLIHTQRWQDLQKLEDTHLNFISDVVVAHCSDDECSLYEAYRVRMSHPLKYSALGTWRNGTLYLGSKLKKNDLDWDVIIGGIYITGFDNGSGEPPDFEERSVYPGKEIFTRYHIQLHRHLEILLKFKLKIVRSATYGYPLPNGTYDGLIGDILSGKIDLGVTAIEPRPGRLELVNFFQSYWKIRMIFMLRQPRALGSFSALAKPLSSDVWASILFLLILFAICYDVIHHWANKGSGRVSYFEGIVVAVGALAQQGLSVDVDITSSRMLCFFWLFLSLIMITYYNAAIMNALLLPAPVSIRTLEQLIAPTSQVQPGLLNITYLVDNRSSYRYVLPNTVKAVKRTSNAVMDLKSGVSRVKDSNFAFCAEDILLYEQVQRTFDDAQKCDLSYIDLLKPFGLNSPIGKNSPFKEIIGRGLMYLQENGLVEREKRHWRPLTPQCFGSISFFYVSLKAVGISFTIFLAGLLASICIYLLEILHHSRKCSSRKLS